ncbi:hypothetical protein N0V88_002463 [Collariella sp. IMI 366227]|nr:hypothetical protein N0V88_002463 [Collariella sp. IMI 366227]
MEDLLRTQSKLREERGLHKVKAVPNPNYKRHGTKSYVYALNRFRFQPTKPGPYFQKYKETQDKEPIRKYLGLYKRSRVEEHEPGFVTAEDQQNDSEYLCEITIGTEPQKVTLDFDTGSADLWVSQKAFISEKSTTFKVAKDQSWRIQYGDGSSASGFVGTDVISLGGLKIENQAIEVAKQMSAQFSEGTMDGLLGLAFSTINTIEAGGKPSPQPTPVDNMISQKDIPADAELFTSAMYSTRDGGEQSFYTFGWIDEELVKQSGEDITWTNIDNSEGFWMFSSSHAVVNGEKVRTRRNRAIADTGTTLALVSDEVCEALYAQIKGAEYNYEYQGYIIPKTVTLEDLPEFKIAVGDHDFLIQKEDLLFAPADDNSWYGGVQSRGENPFDILGDTFLKSIYAIWDQGRKRFGAVPKIQKTQSLEWPGMPANGNGNGNGDGSSSSNGNSSNPKGPSGNGTSSKGSEGQNGKKDQEPSNNGTSSNGNGTSSNGNGTSSNGNGISSNGNGTSPNDGEARRMKNRPAKPSVDEQPRAPRRELVTPTKAWQDISAPFRDMRE